MLTTASDFLLVLWPCLPHFYTFIRQIIETYFRRQLSPWSNKMFNHQQTQQLFHLQVQRSVKYFVQFSLSHPSNYNGIWFGCFCFIPNLIWQLLHVWSVFVWYRTVLSNSWQTMEITQSCITELNSWFLCLMTLYHGTF